MRNYENMLIPSIKKEKKLIKLKVFRFPVVVVVGLVGERRFHIINCDVKDTSHKHALLLWILMKIDT